MHQDYKKNMNSKLEYFDLLNEFVEYASKRLIIEQEKNKKVKMVMKIACKMMK